MDAAWGGVIGGFLGSLVGASATYWGPLVVQKRQREESGRQAIADVYVTTRGWLQYLHDVCRDAAVSDTLPSIQVFDAEARELRNAAELSLARLLTIGADDFYGSVATDLRLLHDVVRNAVQTGNAEWAADLASAHFFPSAVRARQRAKEEWLDQLARTHLPQRLRRFWLTSSP